MATLQFIPSNTPILLTAWPPQPPPHTHTHAKVTRLNAQLRAINLQFRQQLSALTKDAKVRQGADSLHYLT